MKHFIMVEHHPETKAVVRRAAVEYKGDEATYTLHSDDLDTFRMADLVLLIDDGDHKVVLSKSRYRDTMEYGPLVPVQRHINAERELERVKELYRQLREKVAAAVDTLTLQGDLKKNA